VTNRDFGKALGQALGRPSAIPVPGFALRTALGEVASTVLEGQRAVPQRLQELDFTFRYVDITTALNDLI
jgi:NAD dependent epimerase/dehydratase family enzyme